MFIGRERELKNLNDLYESIKFEFVVIYGRRRIGKTTLINEFISDKESIFFSGLEANSKENLEGLSQSVMALSSDFYDASSSFLSYKEVFDTVFRIAEKRRIIMVIDEYPYLASSYKTISSLLQTYIDKYKDTSKLFLILCGSSLSFMENQVLGYKSPLFGRRTAQFKITPFEFVEAQKYYSNFSIYDTATVYGITGGIPLYMSLINENKSLEDNIKTNFLTPSAYLFEEPINLVKQECREPAQYNSIIKAIATGSSRLSEICSKTDLDSGLCSSYLSTLISIGIVKKARPFGEKATRKTIYAVEDSMFRFWYRFVPANSALINKGLSDNVYRKIEPQIPAFMGFVFEDICKQYLWKLNIEGTAPIEFTDLGRWWGNDPINKCEAEIDILALDDNDGAIFAECKWTNEKVDVAVLDTLVDRSRLFRYKNNYLYLFAKTGFTNGCVEKAKAMSNVKLVTFDEMVN